MYSLIYILTVLIWGSTWFAVKFQLGVVPPIMSVGYRFLLAALLLFGWCLIRGAKFKFTVRDHGFLLLQGGCLFGLNYIFAYLANQNLTSGVNAVVFSCVLVFNILNAAFFFHQRISALTLAGAAVGLVGIVSVFWSELALIKNSGAPLLGMVESVAGAAVASFGQIISVRNHRRSLPVMESNAFAMLYGSLLTLSYLSLRAVFGGAPFVFDFSLPYVGSLLYLSVVGSIVAFGFYLTLFGKLGASKASYILVLAPVVAMGFSSIFESFVWTPLSVFGIALVLLGNVLIRRGA